MHCVGFFFYLNEYGSERYVLKFEVVGIEIFRLKEGCKFKKY